MVELLFVLMGVALTVVVQSTVKNVRAGNAERKAELERYIQAEVHRRQYNADNWGDLPEPPPFKANGRSFVPIRHP